MNAIPRASGERIEFPRGIPVTPIPAHLTTAGASTRTVLAELLARRQSIVLALLAELVDEPTLQRALDAFAGALQQRFVAERVAVALADDDGVLHLGAISQRTLVDPGAIEVRLLLEAMEEAAAFETTVRYPPDGGRLSTCAAHRALVAGRAGTCVASVPLYHDDKLIGAILLERVAAKIFAPSTLLLLERVAFVSAPVLALRREAHRGAFGRLRRDVRAALVHRFGAERFGARLLLGIALVALVLGLVVPVEREISATAELVPRERRLVTAPVAGFVDEVLVGAGERVVPGQLLGRLDRRELELEAVREAGEMATAAADLRAAMANHDRQASAIARARLEQERVQRALVEHRLERAELRAPIAGLIASGDPLDAVGAPVERGETLFEIVPGDGYEVHLLVDARDIRDVREGQKGRLVLEARPREPLALVLRTIHPVAESGGGMNRFRVRADLTDDGASGSGALQLRPGESGLARLPVARTSFLGRLAQPILTRVAELLWRFVG